MRIHELLRAPHYVVVIIWYLNNSYLIWSLFFISFRNQVTKQLPRVPPYITCNKDKFWWKIHKLSRQIIPEAETGTSTGFEPRAWPPKMWLPWLPMAECLMGMGPNLNTQMGIYIEPNMSNPGQTPPLLIMHPQHYPPGPTTWNPLKWAEEYPTANPPPPAAHPILTPLSATELGDSRDLLMYPHPYPLDWGKGGIPQPHRNITATSIATALTPLPLTHHPFLGNPPCRRQFQCRPPPAGYPRGVQEVEGVRHP